MAQMFKRNLRVGRIGSIEVMPSLQFIAKCARQILIMKTNLRCMQGDVLNTTQETIVHLIDGFNTSLVAYVKVIIDLSIT